jgi:nucleotide-binding universal stress UspA family protein
MEIVNFDALLWGANVALVAAAASIVWIAGVRLSAYAKVIADRTGAVRLLLACCCSAPLREGDLRAAIVEESDEWSADLIVVGSQGRTIAR